MIEMLSSETKFDSPDRIFTETFINGDAVLLLRLGGLDFEAGPHWPRTSLKEIKEENQ